MARIDHSNCSHPRTPAGRAGCRKAGTWQEAAGIKPLKANKPTDCPGGDGHDEHLALNGECPWCGAVKPAEKPRKARSTRGGTDAPDAGRSARTRALKAEHDLADVPHVFTAVIRWAWERGLEVRTANPYNETERRIEIKASQGVGTLVWRHTNPNGINGQFWRPNDTSVTSRVSTVNELMRRM